MLPLLYFFPQSPFTTSQYFSPPAIASIPRLPGSLLFVFVLFFTHRKTAPPLLCPLIFVLKKAGGILRVFPPRVRSSFIVCDLLFFIPSRVFVFVGINECLYRVTFCVLSRNVSVRLFRVCFKKHLYTLYPPFEHPLFSCEGLFTLHIYSIYSILWESITKKLI